MKRTAPELQRLADCAWGEITRFCNPDSCVLATRVFVDALAALGDRSADGMVMQVIVLSPPAARHREAHGCHILSCQERELGGYTVAVLGEDPNSPGVGIADVWKGHLAAVVQKRWIVDLTLSQVSRPDLGLTVEGTLVFEAPKPLLHGQATADLVDESGQHFLYRAVPNAERAWRSSADWAWQTAFRHELMLGTLARYSGREPRYSQRTLAVHAMVGKV